MLRSIATEEEELDWRAEKNTRFWDLGWGISQREKGPGLLQLFTTT
jgi:hypothetical protein